MDSQRYRLLKTTQICLFFCICFLTAASLQIDHAPDEAMRYLIPQYIVKHHALPVGNEAEVMHSLWGFSYAFYPYLTSILSAVFMEIASLCSGGAASLLLAARMVSVLSGTIALSFIIKTGELLYKDKKYALILGIFCGFLPQFVFLCSYQNNDSFAILCTAMMVYFWIKGRKDGWTWPTCLKLGLACGLCALSYYNAYIYLICTIPALFVGRLDRGLTTSGQTPASPEGWHSTWAGIGSYRHRLEKILTRAGLVLLPAFLVAGWFFIRNGILHQGDFLGMRTTNEMAEEHAQEEYKPSNKVTPAREGLSLTDTFFRTYKDHKANWFVSSICSFIGSFSYLSIHLSNLMYALYLAILGLGFLLFFFLSLRQNWWKEKDRRLLFLLFTACILVTPALSMFHSYYSDYQAQGRYLMPALLPLMVFVTDGYKVSMEKCQAKMKRAAFSILLVAIYLLLFAISYLKYLLPNCLSFSF